MRETETSLASLLPLEEQHRLSMAIKLSSSEYRSQCRRWKEKKKTGKDRMDDYGDEMTSQILSQ